MNHTTWTHLLARWMVRPLVGTGVTPSHLTTLRIATGLLACVLLALDPRGLWGGVAWLVSTFLDRADGELARIGDMRSEAGHIYDYWADNLVSACFFVAIGIGLRGSFLHTWSIPIVIVTGAAVLLSNRWSEQLENANGRTARAYTGAWGFDFDDMLYLLAPFAWLGWLPPILVGAAIVSTTIAVITWFRLSRLPQGA